MKQKNGIVTAAKQLASSHWDNRPDNTDISLLVIHNISLPAGDFSGHNVEDFFTGQLNYKTHPSFLELENLRVSSHLYIRRNGSCIQFVNFEKRAWHAGVSNFQGRENCNDFSIGIELEGTDDCDFTNEQYHQLADVSRQILKAYPKIRPENICGHSDIAPSRKTDPGPHFDWGRYLNSLDFGDRQNDI